MKDKILYHALQKFMKDSTNFIKKNDYEKDPKYKITSYIPIKKDHKYSVKKIREIDYSRIVLENWSKLEKFPSNKVVKTILKNRIIKLKKLHGDKSLTFSDEESVEENLIYLLIHYLKKYSSKFIPSNFLNTFKKFENYLENNLFSIFFYGSIHNFGSDVTKLNLSNDVWIRKPTDLEFSVISGLINGENKKIDYKLMDLNFIICTKVSKKEGTHLLSEAKSRINDAVNLLKIFTSGDIEIGGLYSGFSELWERDGPNRIEPEIYKPSSNNYFFSKKDLRSFNQFFKDYKKVDFKKSKNNFLKTAIRRFGISVEHREYEDKIVDYVVCLESLYSSKGEALLFKFTNRVALILGKNNDGRVKLLEFMKKSYDVRSKIVHGEIPKPFEIKKKTYSTIDVVIELDKITRKSIRHFLKLTNKYESKDDILKDLDLALQDTRILKKIQIK